MPRVPLARRQVVFLVRFFVLLIVFVGVLSLGVVDRAFVRPFTHGLAAVSAALLNAMAQHVTTSGTLIRGTTFAVDIQNGCNGLEAVAFVVAAVLAFDAPWRARAIGVAIGAIALEAFNVIRIVTLYLIGRDHPSLFDTFHLAVWQTVMFGVATLFFVAWTSRNRPARASA